uniref:Uncharacterized protein n=3 Tax=Micrurus TaxID=8634 RepID=A0A2D4PBB7_MICSU
MLKVETRRNHVDIKGISCITKQTGTETRRTDFSCTWNEKRKKDNEQQTKPYLNPLSEGCRVSFMQLGSTVRNVKAKLNLSCVSLVRIVFILKRMLRAHQILATLSSNKPRSIGKSLLSTCKICSMSVQNGSQQIAKERMTIKDSFINNHNPLPIRPFLKHFPSK